ncbi:MAG: hypothetical protein Q9169_000455 [Polycauliona sp. 2 TL-2023]
MSGHITRGFYGSDGDNPPILLKHRSSKGFILTTIAVAIFSDIFLYGIIVPVVPFALTNRAHVAEKDVQRWVSVLLAVYGAALLASAPVCGFLADRSSSRRLPLLIGLFALAGATLMLCFGHTIAVLIAGRLLQGVSAAIVWTVGLALLVDTVGQKEIGQVMGYISISMSVAILVAPLLGGVVYDRRGYFAVYYMAFALIIVDIILRVVLIEKKVACRWEKHDEAPVASRPVEREKVPPPVQHGDLHSGSRVDITLPENKVTKRWSGGEGSNPIASLPANVQPVAPRASAVSNTDVAVAGPAAGPAAKLDPNNPSDCSHPVESSSASTLNKGHPRPPVVVLLSSRRLLSALYCALVQSALLAAWDAVLPLHVNKLFGWKSLGAGLIFLPLVLPSFLAPVIGAYSDRYGSRLPTSIGFLLATPFLVLLRLVDHGGRAQVVILCVLLACLGIALTIVMTPLLAEIAYILEAKEKHHPGLFGQKGAYAQAYGLFNCAFAGGMLVGPLWAGAVVDNQGWATMCLTLGVLSMVSAIPAFLFTNGWIGEHWKRMKKEDDPGQA